MPRETVRLDHRTDTDVDLDEVVKVIVSAAWPLILMHPAVFQVRRIMAGTDINGGSNAPGRQP